MQDDDARRNADLDAMRSARYQGGQAAQDQMRQAQRYQSMAEAPPAQVPKTEPSDAEQVVKLTEKLNAVMAERDGLRAQLDAFATTIRVQAKVP